MAPRVDVCVCTHDPRREILRLVLRSIAHQTCARDLIHVLVVDNASEPTLGETELAPLAGVAHRLIREPRRGVGYARGRAIREGTAPLILFVDDDNELDADYVERAIRIADECPDLGCIGGQLLPAPGVAVPSWFEPLASFFAIDPRGLLLPETSFVTYKWCRAEPPGAGMLVRRAVAELYLGYEDDFGRLGRTEGRPASVEDALLTRQAHRLGLKCSRRPELRLYHHVDPSRFELRRALAFFYSHGGAQIRLARLLGFGQDKYRGESYMVASQLASALFGRADMRTAACLAAWELGRQLERRLR